MNLKPKIILLNGPPRCGKDTAAEFLLANIIGSRHLKFAEPLKRAVPAMYGLKPRQWKDLYENHKDEPTPALLGLSPRQAMISASEDWMKPLHGEDVFGKIAARSVRFGMPAGTVVVSDCGFDSEVVPMVDSFGAKNLLIIAIKRKGKSFANDSRGYIAKPAKAKRVVVNNNGSKDNFELDVLGAAMDWLESFS